MGPSNHTPAQSPSLVGPNQNNGPVNSTKFCKTYFAKTATACKWRYICSAFSSAGHPRGLALRRMYYAGVAYV